MLEVKPSKNWNISMLLVGIAISCLIYFFSKDLFFSGIAIVLVVIGSILNSRSKISLANDKLVYVSILGRKTISVGNIVSIKLRAGAKQVILVVFGKNNGGKEQVILRVYNIVIYKNSDLKNLIDEIIKINSAIVLSDQIKNLMEGKAYVVTSFGDA